MVTRGVIYVHSCPPAVCPHAEWAISGVLGMPVSLQWSAQPASPGQLRAECAWDGAAGTGGTVATALRAWPMLRFEVTEDPSPGCDGERILHVPGRGINRLATGANGDIVVGEQRLRAIRAECATTEDFRHAVDTALGLAWDAELEPYRHAGDGAPVAWLHRVG